MQKNNYLFGGVSFDGLPVNLSYALLRVLAGAMMALGHGWEKMPPPGSFIAAVDKMGFPVPTVFAWLAAIAELAGGAFVAAGLLTRPAALLVTCTMAVAAFLQHAGSGLMQREISLLYGAVFLLFAVMGAGRISVDALIRKA